MDMDTQLPKTVRIIPHVCLPEYDPSHGDRAGKGVCRSGSRGDQETDRLSALSTPVLLFALSGHLLL